MKKAICCLIMVVLLVGSLVSCKKEQSLEHPFPQRFNLNYQEKYYSIQSESDLKTFIVTTVTAKGMEVMEAGLEKLVDELGEFYAIRAKYNADGQIVVMTIPLNEPDEIISKTGTGGVATYFAECTMTCSPPLGCSTCNQTVYERCKRQTCSCAEGGPWGCNAEVTF